MVPRNDTVFGILALVFFIFLRSAESEVPQEEVDALQKIVTTLGATYWKFNADSCRIEMVGLTPEPPNGAESDIQCICNIENTTGCHITKIALKSYNLPGVLPSELVNLPYIQEIDLAYNYLNGTIPSEWSLTKLNSISVFANRLSGEIPKELGNIISLTYLNLEANGFFGTVPPELGKLMNLRTLIMSSNQLSGKLPAAFSGLKNLTDFRISDNNFSGPIPDFIQNWKQLGRLEMQASGLEGPIPASISLLNKLTKLRISDIKGPSQGFPVLSNMTDMDTLILRNCKISGEIPAYVWRMRLLNMFDVSFNELMGIIPDGFSSRSGLRFIFLTGNKLSGSVPSSILQDGMNVDLSYNNFTWQGPEQPACRQYMNLYINLFRSSSTSDDLRNILPCSQDLTCSKYRCSFHVNSGGNDLTIEESKREVLYERDAAVEGGSAKFYNATNYWGFSSTGDFLDDSNAQNTRYTISSSKKKNNVTIPVTIGVVVSITILMLSILWWKGYVLGRKRKGRDFEGLGPQMVSFTLKQLKAATKNFDNVNKIGECGFGPVYKGLLPDGTVIAVKQLSAKSRQEDQEFLNEIGLISCVKHPNLVKLHGCCVESDQLMLVYEYMENNSLANALFAEEGRFPV